MSDAKATFGINLEGNAAAVSNEQASALENLRAKIMGSEDAVKSMSSALRRLKGSTEEVKSAKAELKTKIEGERAAISSAQVGLVRAGVSYDALAAKARKLAAEQAKAKTTALASKGALADLAEKFKSAGGAAGLMKIAVLGTVGALVALAAASVGAAFGLAKFILEGANALRTANLFREAATGSASSAANLGDHIDALGRRVSTSKDKLNEMAISMAKLRLSGQAQVDTLNLVAQAGDAMGDDVGNKLKELVARSQLTQRMFVSPQELFGTGLEFKDVAGELAKQMHVGVNDAQIALFQGRVKLDDGAKALRAAVEKRFGEINARKMLDLNVQAAKFRERLVALTSGVKLEPLLKVIDSIAGAFDESTITGRALKELVTVVGNGLVGAFTAVGPLARETLIGMITAAYDVGTAFYKTRNALRTAFGDSSVTDRIDLMRVALIAGKVAVYGFAGGLLLTYATVRALAAAIEFVATPVVKVADSVDGLRKRLGLGWSEVGRAIIDGLISGLVPGGPRVVAVVKGLAEKVKGAFAGKLEIHSPSKVFAEYADDSIEGYAGRLEKGAPRAARAAEALAPAPTGGAAGGARGGTIKVEVNYTVNVHGGGEDVQKQLASQSFLEGLTKAVQDACVGAGIPVTV